MEFGDGREQADSYAEQALELMRKYGIPPTPNNFTIWYAYAGEKFPDLRKALDALIANDEHFDAMQNAGLYDKFFSDADDGLAVHETGRRIEGQMARVLEMLGNASEGVDNFEASLKTGLGSIASSDGLTGIRAAVQRLVAETQQMQSSNKKLQEKLENSSSEIASLRQNLEDVQREAMTDALTGIANRKMFDASLRRAAAESAETGEPMCLALTDIDFFKKFNDTYGHQTGDQVLKLVARIMKENVKGRDVAARYGGEEFGVILPRTSIEDAHTVCEQIRNTVSTKRIRNRQTGEEMGNITLSLGIALYRKGEPLSELIHRADEGLYFAKRNGRNQTVLEDQLDTIEAN
ncbi:GGDEF domain-containing protein [Marivibrio halodurans]|uniref:diguanylate cyclase n=1 Tax=Marivibrio halodurans TaxID=2039722 RepID=A0A8J7SIF5_9PROT|nr:GGDEF domain-containing protein [Marivibrio halodurans]